MQPLYRVTGGETLSPLLFFKKTLKIDVAKINRITVTESGNETAWGIVMKDGGEESLSLLTNVTLDGKPAALAGFVGRVPAGYKLFPIHVIEEIQFDAKPKKFDASQRAPHAPAWGIRPQQSASPQREARASGLSRSPLLCAAGSAGLPTQ